jgi:hypothetical protein
MKTAGHCRTTSMFNLPTILIALLLLCIMILRWGMPRNRWLAAPFVLGACVSAYMTVRIAALAGFVEWQ